VATVASEHEQELCAGLTDAERTLLRGLLGRVATHHGLSPGPDLPPEAHR
jgi:hypothetical protein